MKRIINYTLFIAIVIGFGSCEKVKVNQTFDDVFDISGIQELNAKISNPEALPLLNEEIQNTNLILVKKIEDITLPEMIDHYEAALKLSSKEIDMLLKNDSKTYIDVINRFGSLPLQLEGLTSNDLQSAKLSSMNKYSIKVKTAPENFYSTDYYTAVIEMQNFIQNEVVAPLKGATIPPGSGTPLPSATVDYYKIISLNNVWDIWWTYWSDGTRTKHKGAAGSFPG